MSSPAHTAKRGTFEEFRDVYDGEASGALLMNALTNRDADARADIAGLLLDDGADASVVEYGQNALSVLIGAHRYVGPRDGELFARLVAGGADVNYRERRGQLVVHLVAMSRVETEDMRAPMYAALFGHPDLDLSKLVNVRREEPTMLDWLKAYAAQRPEKHRILAGYLERYRDRI
ncbi:hypothetical protein [uncultured Corynebacterium sp.]|uniref:hypothetical protein n=1 Tax=uncultured Corynebacterium sp. TaxID=159447 RepID=UPI0025F7508E|nr:hypothetical protein [uncultured Corynebacterium sp.]